MKVAKKSTLRNQLMLWEPDKRISSLGHVRHVCGDYFERLTARVTGGKRIDSDSTCDYCPDILTPSGDFLEVKSCGVNRQVIVYDWRVQKDKEFVSQGNRLWYCMWHHGMESKGLGWESDVRRELDSSVRFCCVVTAQTMWELVATRELRKLAFGKYSEQYQKRNRGYGYTIPLTKVLAECGDRYETNGFELWVESFDAHSIFYGETGNGRSATIENQPGGGASPGGKASGKGRKPPSRPTQGGSGRRSGPAGPSHTPRRADRGVARSERLLDLPARRVRGRKDHPGDHGARRRTVHVRPGSQVGLS